MKEAKDRMSKGVASGIVALVFLVLGFQLAVFVIKVVERPPERCRVEPGMTKGEPGMTKVEPGDTVVQPAVEAVREAERTKFGGYDRPAESGRGRPAKKPAARACESFAFDPNTVTVADLQRLGLSERQAESIENYRSKGGRFRSKADFQKMYVVSDTLYARLEPYIDIPKLELNTADSAALLTLRGIGPYYAHKILAYRDRLGGFVDAAQLREIEGIDAERFAGLADQVSVDPAKIRKLDLWHASDTALARHPYIGPRAARGIVRYRELAAPPRQTLSDLSREHILPEENIEKLKNYIDIQ